MSDTLRVSNIHFGNVASNYNQPQMGFTSVGIGSTTNYGFLQFFGTSNTLCWTANGTVGIGTTNPTAALQVNGNVSIGTRFLGTTDIVTAGVFWIGLNGTGTEFDRLAVGIVGNQTTGVVDTIQLNKNTNVLGNFIKQGTTTGYDTRISGGTATNSGYVDFFANGASRGYIGNASTVDVDIVAQNGAKLNFYTAGAKRLFIDTAGDTNIIGNFYKTGDTLGYNMNINGGTTSNSPNIDFYANFQRKMYIGYANATDAFITAENSANLNLGTQGVTRLMIDTPGNLVFGLTKAFYMYFNSAPNNAGFITNAGGDLSIFSGTSGVGNRLTVMAGGFVGISTGAPLARLTVRNGYNDGDTGGLCIDATDGAVYNMRLSSFVQGGSQVAYRFGVNNTTSSSPHTLVLGYNGNVGIGSSNPVERLDVAGTIRGYLFSTQQKFITVSVTGNNEIIPNSTNYALNPYFGTETILLITAHCTNYNSGNTISTSGYVAYSGVAPSYANAYGQVGVWGTGCQIVGSGYGIFLSVANASYYGTYRINIIRVN